MAVPDPQTVYLIARASYVAGKYAYKQADKRVAEYALEQGISKQDAWRIVRAEAIRQGDDQMTKAADRILQMGPVGQAVLNTAVPGAPLLALGWRGLKTRRVRE